MKNSVDPAAEERSRKVSAKMRLQADGTKLMVAKASGVVSARQNGSPPQNPKRLLRIAG